MSITKKLKITIRNNKQVIKKQLKINTNYKPKKEIRIETYMKYYISKEDKQRYKNIESNINNGEVYICEYDELCRYFWFIDRNVTIPFSLIHHKAIELKKIDNNYVINPCL